MEKNFEEARNYVSGKIQRAMKRDETCVCIDFTPFGDRDLCEKVIKTLDKKKFLNRTLQTHLGVFVTICWNKNDNFIKENI